MFGDAAPRLDAACIVAGVDHEISLACDAFYAALGIPRVSRHWTRAHIVEMLDEVHGLYGLSSGSRGTEELARGIEEQAIKQARSFMGRPR